MAVVVFSATSIGHRCNRDDTENFKKVCKGGASVFLYGTIPIAMYDVPQFAALMIGLVFIGWIAFCKSRIQPVCDRITALEDRLSSQSVIEFLL